MGQRYEGVEDFLHDVRDPSSGGDDPKPEHN